MSRSRSPVNNIQSPETRDRRMSVASNHSRRSMDQDEVPAKRPRTDSRNEDKARGKRLFGNILGTLKQFKKEDKTSRTSEAAKRREQVSERIASKIRSEHALQHDIMGTEKSYRELKISTEALEQNIKQKEIALQARHASMKPASRFLYTSLPPSSLPLFEGSLLNPSPIPLNQGPPKEPHPHALKPLFFLPKKLLPEQQSELDSRIANLDELITDEAAAFSTEKQNAQERIKKNRAEIAELSGKLSELKKNVKPLEIRGRAATSDQVDELGRERRRESTGMEVDGEGDRREAKEERDKEAGLQIRGENGDVEVEY